MTGDQEQAASAHERVTAFAVATQNAGLNGEICASGVDDEVPRIVPPACERAVELAPEDGGVRDSRGLAREVSGDFPGAIADFAYVVSWAKAEGRDPLMIQERQAWIAALQAGRNPFDEETVSNRTRIDTPPVPSPDLQAVAAPGAVATPAGTTLPAGTPAVSSFVPATATTATESATD